MLVYSIFSAVFGFDKLRRAYLSLLQMLYQVSQGEGERREGRGREGRGREGKGRGRRGEGRERKESKGRGEEGREMKRGEREKEGREDKSGRGGVVEKKCTKQLFLFFGLQLVGLRMKTRFQPEGMFWVISFML